MSKYRTHYLRVSEKEVLPLEIHSLQRQEASRSEPWLKERHLQEILQLLHATVTTYVESRKSKQKTSNTNKLQQKISDILTGSSVRFGYVLKSRPASQTCLIDCSFAIGDKTNEGLLSYHVLKDKLVVYAQPLVPGSPKGMSQLMKVLKDKRRSSGQGVSISSYFQKIPSQTVSQSASQGTSQQEVLTQSKPAVKPGINQSAACSRTDHENTSSQTLPGLPPAPPSDGKRNKIKSIIERGDIGHTRKMKSSHSSDRKTSSTNKDSIQEDDGLAIQEQCSVREITRKSCDQEEMGSSLNIMETGQFDDCLVTPCESPLDTGPLSTGGKSYMIGDVQISQVKSPVISINEDKADGVHSVTLISVQQCQDIQREAQQIKTNLTSQTLHNQSDSHTSDTDNQSECCTLDTDNQSEKENKNSVNQSLSQSDSSDDMSELPSASFCTRRAQHRSSIAYIAKLKQLKTYEADIDSDSLTNSPKFGGRKKVEKDSKTETGSKIASMENSVPKTNALKSSILHARGKRKFPKFSDSDSEENLPDKKLKTKHCSQSFVNLDKLASNSKKLTISNSFFTGDGGKSQPSLSYFLNAGKKSESKKSESMKIVSKKSESKKSESIETCGPSKLTGINAEKMEEDSEIGDMDCELIKELSDIPRIKSEADQQLRDEIRAVSSVSRLNEEHIHYLIRSNEQYLRQIFEGRVVCDRHQAYKEGGNRRLYLNYKSRLGQYTEEQVDTVMESLMAMFCKRHHKYLDYIMKVLLPEMLIKLHMDVHGTTHEESERMLAPKQFAAVPSP